MSTGTARAPAAGDVSRARRSPRGSRRCRRVLLVAAALMVVTTALVTVAALAVRAEMAAAQDAVRGGVAAMVAGDARAASAAFARADEHASAATAHLSGPPLRVVGMVPLARRQVHTAGALVSATRLVARAGQQVAGGVLELDGGIAAIAPGEDGFPVEPLLAIQPRLRRAADLAADAQRIVRAADHRLLLPQLRAGRAAALTGLQPAVRSLEASAALTDALPAFLGAGGTRRYLFGAATLAEARGTGGLIGAYAPMTVRGGAVRFGPFVPASQLPRAVDDPPDPPTRDYQRRYGQFAAAGHWSNVNMTPDFPTAAVAIERLYARTVGDRVDGVVVADPFALQLLLQATGPVEVPGVGVVRAGTVVDRLTLDSYVDLPDPAERKAVLGDVAVAVLERFLRSDAPPRRKMRLLTEAVAGGHVLLHARDREVQVAFARAGVAGALLETDDDFVAVVANNAAANKVDSFAQRSLEYHVDLRPGGTARGRLAVEVTNSAPSSGLPAYVIGPSDERFAPGENVTLLSTYCAASCRSDGYRVDGETVPIGQQAELGRQVLPATVRVPSGTTRTLTYDWRVLRGWDASGAGGIYRLTVQGQPTVRPTAASVRIRVPDGMHVTRATEGARVNGGEVRWSGTLDRVLRIEVGFTPRRTAWQRLRAALDPLP